MAKQAGSTDAGTHEPYWYESFVGLLEVVDMLDDSNGIRSVAFQVKDISGWDDVVVSLSNGRRRCYQVKNTRVEKSLAFGDLTKADDEEKSLLSSLFNSWLSSGLNDGLTECILYTNREAGSRWSKTNNGSRRPPLLKFFGWLTKARKSALVLSDIVPPDDLKDAWREWLGQIASGSEEEQFQFMAALTIRVAEDDLDQLAEVVQEKLAKAFGVSLESVHSLFTSLQASLRKWTTKHTVVNVEELCLELRLPPSERELPSAPPPPSPFFSTREPLVDSIVCNLVEAEGKPIVFLTGEPGSGKTSVVSRLVNRRVDEPFGGVVALRFFCFEPIQPENPVLAPDASRVTPEELWFGLLTQLREGLSGRLHELSVPLRNSMLNWQTARTHVLRLADALGRQFGRKLVIVVDGIDHAARAAQTTPKAYEFFRSLPSPDELAPLAIRFLIAGQPAAQYRHQYPSFLLGEHPLVTPVSLPLLTSTDISQLLNDSTSQIPVAQHADVVRLIEEHARGNTLSTVFAVAEAENVADVGQLDARLRNRRLADGIDAYYSAIWHHAIEHASTYANQIEPNLAGTISMAQVDVTPALFSSAFMDWGLPERWWRSILNSLSPILTQGSGGYRVRHNDIRVFLSRRFASFDVDEREAVASKLADYYFESRKDRFATHIQLFDLLKVAGRHKDAAKVFTTNWVLEAGALGISNDVLMSEAAEATAALLKLEEWPSVVTVACALETLDRLRESREYWQLGSHKVRKHVPPILRSEASVRPLSQWKLADFATVIEDAQLLLNCGEHARASSLLERWFGGLDLSQLFSVLGDEIKTDIEMWQRKDRGYVEESSALHAYGYLTGKLRRKISVGTLNSKLAEWALRTFESGYVEFVTEDVAVDSLDELCCTHVPVLLASWEQLLRTLAVKKNWLVVRETLERLEPHRDKFDPILKAEACSWSLRAGLSQKIQSWLLPLDQEGYGLEKQGKGSDRFGDRERRIAALLAITHAIGWTRLDLDPGDIAAAVYPAYVTHDSELETKAPTTLILRASAMLGRLEAAERKGGVAEAVALVPPESIGRLLASLWATKQWNHSFYDKTTAARLAKELVEFCAPLGDSYITACYAAAEPYSMKFPIDFWKDGLWAATQNAGKTDVLRIWVEKWLQPNGDAWQLPRGEIKETVLALAGFARRIDLENLAGDAESRLCWYQVGYRDRKDYSFFHVGEWFKSAAKANPEIWASAGWQLLSIFEACGNQDGDNRFESSLFIEISEAAIRCGASDWWRLIRPSLRRMDDDRWHEEITQSLIQGVTNALERGTKLSTDDCCIVFSLAIAFSFWMNYGDSVRLQQLSHAMLKSRHDEFQRIQLERRLNRISCRHVISAKPAPIAPTISESNSPFAVNVSEIDLRPDPEPSVQLILQRVQEGQSIKLCQARLAVEQLMRHGNAARIRDTLRCVGCGPGLGTEWSNVESKVEESLGSIVSMVSETDLWSLIEAIVKQVSDDKTWTVGVKSNLVRVAHFRSIRHSNAHLMEGLQTQLDMHTRWAYGGESLPEIKPTTMADFDENVSWTSIALNLTSCLMESSSSEVVGAAIEGMHALVDSDPSLIVQFFAHTKTNWSRRWLLMAAEVWAVLHPNSMASIVSELNSALHHGTLEERLQSWVVLCRRADALSENRPVFPIPRSEQNRVNGPAKRLLEAPAERHGHALFPSRHSSALTLLNRLEYYGFDFNPLEGLIAKSLTETEAFERRGPHRRNSFDCSTLVVEEAVGNAILSVLSANRFSQADMSLLAQSFLSNEEPWIQRSSPRSAAHLTDWPHKNEYGSEKLASGIVRDGLLKVVQSGELPEGWKTVAARCYSGTWEHDFLLWVWWETTPSSSLITRSSRPMCDSARTFPWFFSDATEITTVRDRFVSAYFTGGLRRLSNGALEIQPPTAWRDELGWKQDLRAPLVWYHNHSVVAKFERFHGPLRDNPSGPLFRQPLVERWIVSEKAFDHMERIMGRLTMKTDFERQVCNWG